MKLLYIFGISTLRSTSLNFLRIFRQRGVLFSDKFKGIWCFDNNQLNTFGDYLCNKNPGRQTDGQTVRRTDGQMDRRTDRQAETEDLFLRTLGIMKRRENVNVKNWSKVMSTELL